MPNTLTFEHVMTPTGLQGPVRLILDDAGRIQEIEQLDALPADHDGRLAIPGMPNAHSHAFQRALVGRGEQRAGEDSFWSWREAMYGLAQSVTPEDCYRIARRCFRDMLSAGFTSLAEFHYLHHRADGEPGQEMAAAVVRAAVDEGLPLTLLPVLYRDGGFGQVAGDRQRRFLHRDLDSFGDTLNALSNLGVDLGVAAHSLRAVPAAMLPDLVALTDELIGLGAPLHIHISEQTAEVDACIRHHGRRPVELLADTVALSPRWNLVHATHLNAQELDLIAESGAAVVLCPLTEAYLGDGIFPATELAARGGRFSIGSDSDVRIDACEELRMLEYGQRLRDRARARLADDTGLGIPLWSRCAAVGAVSVGQPVGAVEIGLRADLVVLDEASPVFEDVPVARWMDAWITAGSRADIAAVYVAGAKRFPGAHV